MVKSTMNKEFFNRIKKGSAHIEGAPFIVSDRHWGFSVVLDANTRIHFIEGEPSAHLHKYRTEDYILQDGVMEVYRGIFYEGDLEKTIANLEVIKMSPGDRVVMPPNMVHIPVNVSPTGSIFAEISHGPYEEGDIERVYDKNARSLELAEKWSALGYKKGISIVDLIVLIKNKKLRKKKKNI